MDGLSTISADAVVALSRAIDAADDRGDEDEAIRLASLQGAELNRWLEAHGYPSLRDDGESKKIQGYRDRGKFGLTQGEEMVATGFLTPEAASNAR